MAGFIAVGPAQKLVLNFGWLSGSIELWKYLHPQIATR
jgi:hypothetical protein